MFYSRFAFFHVLVICPKYVWITFLPFWGLRTFDANWTLQDFKRHMYLRQTFVCVYVCGSACVDTHKHFIEGGGWTEHSVFVGLLKQGKEKIAKIPKGPKNSQLGNKQKTQPQPKTSDEFKDMMGAPEAECDADLEELNAFFADKSPEHAATSADSSFPDDGLCVAQVGKEKKVRRCKEKRVAGHA